MAKKPRKPVNYWTEDRCLAVALKHTSRKQFRLAEDGAYSAARRGGFLDKICSHMRFAHAYWTEKLAAAEALKFKSRVAFCRGNSAAYAAAQKYGWLDSICVHMGQKHIHKWTYAKVAKEALRYSTRSMFRDGTKGAYAAALVNGWLDEVCAHMGKGTKRELPRYVYVYKFDALGAAYVGLSRDVALRKREHIYSGTILGQILESGAEHRTFVYGPFAAKEAGQIEERKRSNHEKAGWQMLNVYKGGNAGNAL